MRSPTRGPAASAVLAWGACVLFAAMWTATLLLFLVSDGSADQVLTGLAVGYVVTGALVALREPGNAVGWLLQVVALSLAYQGLVEAYVVVPDRPGAAVVAWTGSVLGSLWLYVAALVLPLVFPDGRLVSPRSWLVVGVAGAALACSLVPTALRPGPIELDSDVVIANPLGVAGAARLLSAVGTLGDLLLAVSLVLAATSLVVRLRRSAGRERAQLSWFAYVGALTLLSLLVALTDAFVGLTGWTGVIGAVGWFTALFLIVIGLPAAIGTAILRHRLYDIDLVLKRTLVYGALTVTLAAVYLACVLGLRTLLAPLAGTSDLAVAASTLAVAALFRPVRGRIQRLVDRRFDRSRYDAGLAVQDFTTRLRHEVDLDAVRRDLEVVVHDTVHPAHVSLWLRGRA